MSSYRLRSERLREAAAEKGDHSSYAVAKRTGLAESTLSRLHRGLAKPATGSLLILATTYGLSMEDLVEPGSGAKENGDDSGAATPESLAETRPNTTCDQ